MLSNFTGYKADNFIKLFLLFHKCSLCTIYSRLSSPQIGHLRRIWMNESFFEIVKRNVSTLKNPSLYHTPNKDNRITLKIRYFFHISFCLLCFGTVSNIPVDLPAFVKMI